MPSCSFLSFSLTLVSARVLCLHGRSTEWVFFDEKGAERFAHEGNTLIPASGKRWTHLHRTSRVPPEQAAAAGSGGSDESLQQQQQQQQKSESTAVRAVTDEPDDASDELPWQVIGIRDEERLESLRRQQQHAARTARAADRRREALAPPPPSAPSREDGPPDGEAAIESPEGLGEMVESGDLKGAAALLASSATSSSDSWTGAVHHVRASRLYRRLRDFASATSAVDAAQRRFPLYHAALFERALIHVDAHDHDAAIDALTRLHAIAPEWPELSTWLVHVHAAMIRNRAAAERRRFEEGEGARRTRPPPPPGCEAIEIGSYELLEERDGHPAQGGKYVRRDDISGTLVGPSKPWCCLSSPEVVCPSVVDKRNWLSGDNYDDTFAITQDGTTLNVSRSDGAGVGWGMALSVLCCTASGREAMEALAEASAPPPSEKDLLAAAEAAAEAERMRSPDHYEVLRIPADFEPQELKKAYRALSLASILTDRADTRSTLRARRLRTTASSIRRAASGASTRGATSTAASTSTASPASLPLLRGSSSPRTTRLSRLATSSRMSTTTAQAGATGRDTDSW